MGAPATSKFHLRGASFSNFANRVENFLRNLPFAGCGHFDYLSGSDNRNGIPVGIEAYAGLRDVIRNDCVESLFEQLLAGILEDVLSLGGEADYQLSLFALAEFSCDVGGGHEFKRKFGATLHLLWRKLLRAVIGDCGRFDKHSGFMAAC